MNRALEGIKVLEVAAFQAGPFCGKLLTALGAEVIKIEAPGTGDPTRLLGPFAGPEGVNGSSRTPDDISLSFLKRSQGKKSVTLNLKSARGRELFLALAKEVDVVFENLQPGTMGRLGIDYAAVCAVNPGIVYCSISGFGQTGPYSGAVAYDIIIQAMSGLMSMTGYPENPPVRAGFFASDGIAPLFGALAIVSALRQRERTGVGQNLDVSMFDCLVSMLWEEPLDYLHSEGLPMRLGNRSPRAAPMECYPTQDGHVVIMAGTEEQWQRFLRAIDATHWSGEPRFANGYLRSQNAAEIDALVAAWTRTRTTQRVQEVMAAHDISCGPVRTVGELMDDPHIKARHLLSPLSHPCLDQPVPALVASFPVHCSGMPTELSDPAPTLGMHNDEIYSRLLGLSSEELAALRQDGVI